MRVWRWCWLVLFLAMLPASVARAASVDDLNAQVAAFEAEGKFAEAYAATQEAVTQLDGSPDIAAWETVTRNRALLTCYYASRCGEALTYFDFFIYVTETLHGRSSPEYVEALLLMAGAETYSGAESSGKAELADELIAQLGLAGDARFEAARNVAESFTQAPTTSAPKSIGELNQRVAELIAGGHFNEALVDAADAVDLMRADGDPADLDAAALHFGKLSCYFAYDCDTGAEFFSFAVTVRERLYGADSPEVAEALLLLADAQNDVYGEGSGDEAEQRADSILAARDIRDEPQFDAARRATTISPMRNVPGGGADGLLERDLHPPALKSDDIAIEDDALELADRGVGAYRSGNTTEAARLLRDAVDLARRQDVGAEDFATMLFNLGYILNRLEGNEAAAKALSEAAEVLERETPVDEEFLGAVLDELETAYRMAEMPDEEQAIHARRLARSSGVVAEGDPQSQLATAQALVDDQDWDPAEKLLRTLCPSLESAEGSVALARCLYLLGMASSDWDEGTKLAERALELRHRFIPENSGELSEVLFFLRYKYTEANDDENLERILLDYVALEEATGMSRNVYLVDMRQVADVQIRLGKFAKAAATLERYRELTLMTGRATETSTTLAEVYAKLGETQRAALEEARLGVAEELQEPYELRSNQLPDPAAPLPSVSRAKFGRLVAAHFTAGAQSEGLLDEAFRAAQAASFSSAGDSLEALEERPTLTDPARAAALGERARLEARYAETQRVWSDPALTDEQKRTEYLKVADEAYALNERISELQSKFGLGSARGEHLYGHYLTLPEVQAQLRQDDLLLFYVDVAPSDTAALETYVWAVTGRSVKWTRLAIASGSIADAVAQLRAKIGVGGASRGPTVLAGGLDGATTFIAASRELYDALVKPALAMQDARTNLIVVPSTSMLGLPLQLLIGDDPAADNSSFASADWLIRQHSVSMLPSVQSLPTLRNLARNATAEALARFVGFGDPLLSERQPRAELCPPRVTTRIEIAARTAPATPFEALFRGGRPDGAAIKALPSLPDSADELCQVAADLGAGEAGLWLRERATETELVELSVSGELSRARVIEFATHAVIDGELGDGSQPAIVLTPPSTPTGTDDGLLTATDVEGLLLDADWVILSACNTGASSNTSDGAFSGLGRAFFYAGGRALLVSNWSVNSSAATELVTRTVRTFAADPAGGKPAALRSAMLSLIEQGGVRADPAYWAPFTLVGL